MRRKLHALLPSGRGRRSYAHLGPPEAHPVEEPDEARVRLVHAHELVRDLPGAAEHVDAARRDVRLDEVPVEPPEEPRRRLTGAVVGARAARAHGDVDLARVQPAKELPHERDRLLEVSRHHGQQLPFRRRQAGADGAERAEVPGERDQLRRERRLLGQEPAQQDERPIRRSVDDEHDLERRVELGSELFQPLDERRQSRLVAIDGHDDRVARRVRAHRAPRTRARPRLPSIRESKGR